MSLVFVIRWFHSVADDWQVIIDTWCWLVISFTGHRRLPTLDQLLVVRSNWFIDDSRFICDTKHAAIVCIRPRHSLSHSTRVVHLREIDIDVFLSLNSPAAVLSAMTKPLKTVAATIGRLRLWSQFLEFFTVAAQTRERSECNLRMHMIVITRPPTHSVGRPVLFCSLFFCLSSSCNTPQRYN